MKNPAFLTLQSARIELSKTWGKTPLDVDGESLDFALQSAPSTGALRILHPLFITKWREPRRHLSTSPIEIVGLDVETHADTGAPALLGYCYPDGSYYCDDTPSITRLARTICNIASQSGYHIAVWGRLDLQIIMRLFAPSESERLAISRGLCGRVTQTGRIDIMPPCLRETQGQTIYIDQYIPGRALRLGFIKQNRAYRIWLYNMAQFYANTLPQTARGMGLDWHEYSKDTHIVSWERYQTESDYRQLVQDSNKQDAKTVQNLARTLQDDFGATFQCDGSPSYPRFLISPGSLTDAATAAMLNAADYKAVSWVWLKRHVWNKTNTPEEIAETECLIAQAFSAGYIDQFAIGFFPHVQTADISAAYPFQIRRLPDLRYSSFIVGVGKLDLDLAQLKSSSTIVETAIISGTITAPDSCPYHPITIRNWHRQNYRPIGTFRAGYTLEERDYLIAHGGSVQIETETYAIVVLSERQESPLARVSRVLGDMRTSLLTQRDATPKDSPEYRVLDSRQYLTKVVDNSAYGKTVMSLEVMDSDSDLSTMDRHKSPKIIGYTTGDRFNELYSVLITARTRVLLAQALSDVAKNGGKPILAMTDSVYWLGHPEQLPLSMFATIKTPGFFEPPETVRNMYLIKTGQYEYQKDDKWFHKVRGLPIPELFQNHRAAYFHPLIAEFARKHRVCKANDVVLDCNTRRLSTIGRPDLERLGAVLEEPTSIRPFVMSNKSNFSLPDWRACVYGHTWIPPPTPALDTLPYAMLTSMYIARLQTASETSEEKERGYDRARKRKRVLREALYYGETIYPGSTSRMKGHE